jgi:MoxR-like ATPase
MASSIPIWCSLAQPKELPPAPYPELRRPSDRLLRRKFDELVKHRTREPGLNSLTHQNIGRRLAARSRFDAQGVVGSRRHKFVQIGTEYQLLVATFALDRHFHGKKGHVLDLDAAAFGRGDQPITAIRLTAQNGGEELDERQAADGRSAIKPGTVARDPHFEVAAVDRQPLPGGGGHCRGGVAGAGIWVSLAPAVEFEEGSFCLTSTAPINASSTDLVAEVEALGRSLSLVRERIGEIIFGQREVVEQALITLLCGGHALLIGVPGLAKTRLVETLGTILGLDDKRIQCTPDLMPADILGSEVLEESDSGRRSFRFIPGPVFCQLLMADEINRASPRTQSALLQAMQEGRVSIAGQYHPLPRPFHVLATQNPLEQEGTYPLPEAQLDRFLLQIDVDYPDLDAERQMLIATTGILEDRPRPAMNVAELMAAQRLVRRIPVGESVVEAILSLVRSGRPDETGIEGVRRFVSWGPGPRASQALMLASRARALIDGRFSPSIDDVLALAPPVLRHRMAVSFAGRAEGVTVARVIEQISAPFR